MKFPHDLTGLRFGDLEVICVEKQGLMKCKCVCGKIKNILRSSLISNKTKSCGCLRKHLMSKHGMSTSSEYSSWEAMKSRCNNVLDSSYEYYGGRGIKIDPEWNDFSNFIRDMGKKPSEEYTLERLDTSKNYFKDNCVWATRKDQQQNKRQQLNNKSGITGVYYSKLGFWVATWSLNGKSYSKTFSILKLGDIIARQKAIEYRIAKISELNNATENYSEAHGKP